MSKKYLGQSKNFNSQTDTQSSISERIAVYGKHYELVVFWIGNNSRQKKWKQICFHLDFGAQGRNRTGTVFPPRDFLTNYSFCCCFKKAFVVWTFSSPYLPLHYMQLQTLGGCRQVSTRSKLSLSFARDCHHHYVLRFPRI